LVVFVGIEVLDGPHHGDLSIYAFLAQVTLTALLLLLKCIKLWSMYNTTLLPPI
jgi:hypothetical protein